ncbi:MAG: hypothetical protein ACXW27_00405 [Allosphingosinicella sp.]
MRRFLLPRKPIGARRAAASIRPPASAPGRGPRSPRPLALIFRAPPRPPAPVIMGADGRTIAIAPRLQIVLNLSNTLSVDHWHLAASARDAAAAPSSPAIFRSRHLHVHGAVERLRAVTRPRPELRDRGDLPRPPHPHFAERRDLRLALLRHETGPVAARSGAWGGPAPERPASPRIRRNRPAPALALPDARSFAVPSGPQAGAESRFAPAVQAHRRLRPAEPVFTKPAPPAAQPAVRLPSARSAAALALSLPARFPLAQPRPTREPGRASALLDFARGTAARARPESRVQGSSERRSPPPSLDYRRPAMSAAAAAAEAPPRAPPPPPPAIDVDALSRDVISRIEKRMRIERERHGRV